MNGRNVSIDLGLKRNKLIIQFLIGFFFSSGRHEGKRGGSMDKKSDK
jgi:hypothetical protein